MLKFTFDITWFPFNFHRKILSFSNNTSCCRRVSPFCSMSMPIECIQERQQIADKICTFSLRPVMAELNITCIFSATWRNNNKLHIQWNHLRHSVNKWLINCCKHASSDGGCRWPSMVLPWPGLHADLYLYWSLLWNKLHGCMDSEDWDA